MRLISSLQPAFHNNGIGANLCIASAWVQRMLSSSAVQSHSNSSSTASSEQSAGEFGAPAGASRPEWKQHVQPMYSVRPSVLSPLHGVHRDAVEVEKRIGFLEHIIEAHLKLADEVHPDELKKHQNAADPVAAALAYRRQQLQEVKTLYDKLRAELQPCQHPSGTLGYYSVMEKALSHQDRDAVEFASVLEGSRSVWDYWFRHFSPQYRGLPSLGSIEKIYNQMDDEALLRQMAGPQVTAAKGPQMPKIDHLGRATATGGRKTSRAQVLLWKGQGRILVNRRPMDAYFGDLLMRGHVLRPLAVTGLMGQIDALVQVDGGGVSGQAQAAAHGIAKALRRLDPDLKPALKAAGLLKRDPRAVERKKPGRAKARKGFAWVKR